MHGIFEVKARVLFSHISFERFCKHSILWLPRLTCGEATCLVEMSEWECNNRIPILTQFWPNVSILVVRHSHSIYSWDLSFCDFWFFFLAVTQWKTAEDDKHLPIISGLRVIENKHFRCRTILIDVIGASWNSQENFFLRRKSILPFKSANYVDPMI